MSGYRPAWPVRLWLRVTEPWHERRRARAYMLGPGTSMRRKAGGTS